MAGPLFTPTTNGAHPRIDVDKMTLLEDAQRKRIRNLMEGAAMDFYGVLGSGFDPYDMYQDLGGWNSYPYVPPPWYKQNQKRGEVLPAYLDENQLRFLRDRSRKLWIENPFVKCAIQNFQNYVVGADGMTIKAMSANKRRPAPDILLQRVDDVLDLWGEANAMPEVEMDIIERMVVDGEKFLRHFPLPKGVVMLRDVEAEHIRSQPGGSFPPHSSFGIECDPEDVHMRTGYHVIEHPITNPLPTFVPAADICHFKWNTPRSAKRGLPLFYECEIMLRDAVDLLRGAVVTANIRARYAVIRKFTSPIIKESVQKFLNEVNLATVTDPTTGSDISVEKKPFGSIVNTGANVELDFPQANLESNQYEVALQMVLRAVAARIGFPEFMLTADASNANYASTLVAESPSTKMFEAFQNKLKRQVAEYRMAQRRSLAWTQIVWAVRCGILPPETLTLVKLQAEGASLVVRDQQGEAETNAVYNQMGVKSKKTISMEQNLDYEEEQQAILDEAEIALQQQQRMALAQQAGHMTPQPQAPGQPQQQEPMQQMGGQEAPTSAPPGSAEGKSMQRAELMHGKPTGDVELEEGWVEIPANAFGVALEDVEKLLRPLQDQIKELQEGKK